jgi:hypothetical protein
MNCIPIAIIKRKKPPNILCTGQLRALPGSSRDSVPLAGSPFGFFLPIPSLAGNTNRKAAFFRNYPLCQKMKILISTLGSRGDTQPYLALAVDLPHD